MSISSSPPSGTDSLFFPSPPPSLPTNSPSPRSLSSFSLQPSTSTPSTTSNELENAVSKHVPSINITMPRKRFPCEYCRHRKRKCDLGEPACGRCVKLKRVCEYISIFTPADLEYEAQLEFKDPSDQPNPISITREEYDELKIDADRLEEEIRGLKEYREKIILGEIELMGNSNQKKSKLIGWQPEVHISKKGSHFKLETNVRSFQNLTEFLDTLHVLELDPPQPYHSALFPMQSNQGIFKMLVGPGKHAHQAHRSIQFRLEWQKKEEHSDEEETENSEEHIEAADIDKRIVDSLLKLQFDCINKDRPVLSRKFIMSNYYDTNKPTRSPVICALAAVATRWVCHHSLDNNMDYLSLQAEEKHKIGEQLFFKAREGFEETFDEPSLENFITTAYLVKYFLLAKKYDRSDVYQNICDRIGQILLSYYSDASCAADSTEQEAFRRVFWLSVQQKLDKRREKRRKPPPPPPQFSRNHHLPPHHYNSPPHNHHPPPQYYPPPPHHGYPPPPHHGYPPHHSYPPPPPPHRGHSPPHHYGHPPPHHGYPPPHHHGHPPPHHHGHPPPHHQDYPPRPPHHDHPPPPHHDHPPPHHHDHPAPHHGRPPPPPPPPHDDHDLSSQDQKDMEKICPFECFNDERGEIATAVLFSRIMNEFQNKFPPRAIGRELNTNKKEKGQCHKFPPRPRRHVDVPAEKVIELEKKLMDFYENVPAQLRVTVDQISVLQYKTEFLDFHSSFPSNIYAELPNRYAIELCIHYYTYWIRLHEKFLPDWGDEPNRSSGICTHAAEVVVTMFQLLNQMRSCHYEFVDLYHAADILYHNASSSNRTLALQARRYMIRSLRVVLSSRFAVLRRGGRGEEGADRILEEMARESIGEEAIAEAKKFLGADLYTY